MSHVSSIFFSVLSSEMKLLRINWQLQTWQKEKIESDVMLCYMMSDQFGKEYGKKWKKIDLHSCKGAMETMSEYHK